MIFMLLLSCSAESQVNPVGYDYDANRMVLIPAGTFRMGNITHHPNGSDSEQPVHTVIITYPFLMSRTEVTQALYEEVMGENPSYFRGQALPVESVSWYDAVAFCNALSKKEGLDTCYTGSGNDIVCDFAANGYRLPTEAEWEYACRAGSETDFHNGNMTHPFNIPLDPVLARTAWYSGNAGSTTHPVARKEANAFGLHDMHGNVWEWCWDRWDENYYEVSPNKDPRGPSTGSHRILRGASWYDHARDCRSSYRYFDYPIRRNNHYYGFRIVRTYKQGS